MRGRCRIAVAAFAALLVTAPGARADDFCVGAPPCLPTLVEALDAARAHPGPDRVLTGPGEHAAPAEPADVPGEPVEIVGDGAGVTRIAPQSGATATLKLADPASRLTAVTVASPGAGATETLLLAGVATHLVVSAPPAVDTPAVRMLANARLGDAIVAGPVEAVAPARVERSILQVNDGAAVTADGGAGALVVEDTEIRLDTATAALDARCAGIVARHLTIVGSAPQAILATCAEKVVDLRNSVLHGQFDEVAEPTGGARVESRHSMHAPDADVIATDRLEPADPAFASAAEGDLRPRPGSPLVDAGEPAPLIPGEGFSDRGSRSRVTDGDGDGVLRRDVGAHELQPPPPPVPEGNVLINGDAEQGASILTAGEGPEPPWWTRTGAFTQVGYGAATRTAQGADVALPSRAMAAALNAGSAFFSAGPGESARLVQRIDVTRAAREIDAGAGSAALSGLIGGYGADEDEIRVRATFRDPEGNALGTVAIGPVAAAERGNATNLLPRSAAGAIPARTRAVDVEISGTRVSAPGSPETYADGYADNLALVLSVPGVPVPGPLEPGTPPVRNLRPFSGITVLTGRPRLSGTGRTRIGIACASATVGRCSGTLELRAQLRRGLAFSRIAQFARFRVAPGRSAAVTMKLTLAARRALRRAKSFRATLRAVVQDGQGLERRTTIPIRVMRSAARRSR